MLRVDLTLETTLFRIALNCWRSLGSFETFAILKRLFLLRISWMMSLVSHGRFFLLGKIDVGMHSSMMSRNTFFQFFQVDWMSFGSIIVSKSASIRRSLALLKSACLYLHILRCVVGVYASASSMLWSLLQLLDGKQHALAKNLSCSKEQATGRDV